MKTVITIVLDEDKEHFNWRCDRGENTELVEIYTKQLADVTVSTPDALEKKEPISDQIYWALNEFHDQIAEQLEPYKLHSPEERLAKVL